MVGNTFPVTCAPKSAATTDPHAEHGYRRLWSGLAAFIFLICWKQGDVAVRPWVRDGQIPPALAQVASARFGPGQLSADGYGAERSLPSRLCLVLAGLDHRHLGRVVLADIIGAAAASLASVLF